MIHVIFGAIVLISYGIVIILRKMTTSSRGAVFDRLPQLDLYEMACLAGGKEWAIKVAIIRLIVWGYLCRIQMQHGLAKYKLEVVPVREFFVEPDFLKSGLMSIDSQYQLSLLENPLERAIFTTMKSTPGANVFFGSSVSEESQKLEDSLRQRGLLVPQRMHRITDTLSLIVLCSIVAIGLVMGLFIVAIGTGVVGLFLIDLTAGTYRTDYGNHVLKTLQQQNKIKRKNADPDAVSDFLMDRMALSRLSVLKGSPIEHLSDTFDISSEL